MLMSMEKLKAGLSRKVLFISGLIGLAGIVSCSKEGRFDKYGCLNVPILTKDDKGKPLATSVSFDSFNRKIKGNGYIMWVAMSDGRTYALVNTKADTSLDSATLYLPGDKKPRKITPEVDTTGAEFLKEAEAHMFKPNLRKILEYKEMFQGVPSVIQGF